MKWKKTLLAAGVALSSCFALADNSDQAYIDNAQEKLKATFSQLQVIDFKPTSVPNLFEMNVGTATIYYHSEQDLLFFGEIYDKEGNNLTQKSRQEAVAKLMKTLPMDQALVLGDPDGIPIIEFTDPDCPYCRNYELWLSTIQNGYKIKRIIFFDNRIHPSASPKIEHILCSDNKEKAFYEAYRNMLPTDLETCPEAEQIMSEHIRIAKTLGVSGTPTFILDDKMNVGFRKEPILQYLDSNK